MMHSHHLPCFLQSASWQDGLQSPRSSHDSVTSVGVAHTHAFAPHSPFKLLKRCGVCDRPLSGSKAAYQCKECGCCAHQQCLPHVNVACSTTVKASSLAPVAPTLRSKHRGLKPLSIRSSDVRREGFLFKRSKWGRWLQLYFVLLEGEPRLFYFDEKPKEEMSFPRGGILLQLAEVHEEHEKPDMFPLTISSPLHADKPSHQLAAQSEADRDAWMQALDTAIQACHHAYSEITDAEWEGEPKIMRPILRAGTQDNLLPNLMTRPKRADLFELSECVDADATQFPLQIKIESITISPPLPPGAEPPTQFVSVR
jgi:hypothetical protein